MTANIHHLVSKIVWRHKHACDIHWHQ